MDPEDKKKLDRILELAEENNEYVKSVRRSQKTSQMWKAIYWVILFALAASGYYAIRPYLDTITSAYDTVKGFDGFTLPNMK
jgi:Ni,Fe-hydrogenase I cytochrome b subunit